MLQSQIDSQAQAQSQSRVCSSDSSSDGSGTGAGEIMLFGVRVKVDPMRKSVSMNNLSEYEHKTARESPNRNLDASVAAANSGYASADDALRNQSNGSRERKRGIPWTEAEHKLFLIGLKKVGKGDWRGISRNFVKTRTPIQVASHALKYFLTRSNLNRKRRRSSLSDITTDSVAVTATATEEQVTESNKDQGVQNPVEMMSLNNGERIELDLNQNQNQRYEPLSLNLSGSSRAPPPQIAGRATVNSLDRRMRQMTEQFQRLTEQNQWLIQVLRQLASTFDVQLAPSPNFSYQPYQDSDSYQPPPQIAGRATVNSLDRRMRQMTEQFQRLTEQNQWLIQGLSQLASAFDVQLAPPPNFSYQHYQDSDSK